MRNARSKTLIAVLVLGLIHCLGEQSWAGYTKSKLVSLVISAEDNGSGLDPQKGAQVKFSNNGRDWSDPEPFLAVKSNWDLTKYGGGEGDGSKMVQIRLKDVAGNWSAQSLKSNIILDTVNPVATAVPPGGNYKKGVTVTLKANEAAEIYYTLDGSQPTVASTKYIGAIVLAQSTTLKFFAEDSAGNRSTVVSQVYTLNITSDTDKDGMPDDWETAHGLNPQVNDAKRDNDKDGYNNLAEYKHGWDPSHPAVTLYVDDDAAEGGNGSEGAPFKTIRQAMEQAIDADTILVLEGRYTESQALYMKERVALTGKPGAVCVIDLAGAGYITGADYSLLSGFRIVNPQVGAGAVSCAGTSPAIENNIITSAADAAGVLLTDGSAASVVNNTILGGYVGIAVDSASPVVRNNIVAYNTLGIAVSGGKPVISYNNVWSNEGNADCPAGNYCGRKAGARSISADPQFVDEASGDYHLQATSPCINKGVSKKAPATDMDGDARPQNKKYDIGADEYVL